MEVFPVRREEIIFGWAMGAGTFGLIPFFLGCCLAWAGWHAVTQIQRAAGGIVEYPLGSLIILLLPAPVGAGASAALFREAFPSSGGAIRISLLGLSVVVLFGFGIFLTTALGAALAVWGGGRGFAAYLLVLAVWFVIFLATGSWVAREKPQDQTI